MRKTFSIILCMALLLGCIPGILPDVTVQASGAITDGVFKYVANGATEVESLTLDDSNYVTTGFIEPVFKTGDGAITNPATAGYYSTINMTSWFHVFKDNNSYANNYFYNFPEKLKESTYIWLTRSWRGNRNDTTYNLNSINAQNSVLSFKINKNAEVYYVAPATSSDTAISNASWLSTDGWNFDGTTIGFGESNGVADENTIRYDWVVAKKSYRVEEGTTATVNIGGWTKNYFVPMVFVRWIDDVTEMAAVSNPNFRWKPNASASVTNLDIQTTYPSVITGNVWTTNFQMFADNTTDLIQTIPAEVQDSDVYFRLKKNWRGDRLDANNPNAQNAQSEVLTFDIDMTANIYYVAQQTWVSGIATSAQWLNDEGWSCLEEKASIDESGTVRDRLVYRKKIVVEPGTTETVKIGGMYQSYWVPVVFVDWVDETTTRNVNVTVTGNGIASKIGNWDVTPGDTFSVQAIPDEGNVIDFVKFNGVTVEVNASGAYTTPAITEDSTIEIAFREMEALPTVITAPFVFNWLDQATHLPSGITFATAGASNDYLLKEYGVVYSDTDTTPTIEEGASKYPGFLKNDAGQFGIKLYGTGLRIGTTYYTTPYAIYENATTGEQIAYGASTSFTPVGTVFGAE